MGGFFVGKIMNGRTEQSSSGHEMRFATAVPRWMDGHGAAKLQVPHNGRFVDGERHHVDPIVPTVVEFLAHPDDFGLFENLDGKFVRTRTGLRTQKSRLLIVTATDGRGRPNGDYTPDEIGKIRLRESRRGEQRIGATASAFLGFPSDGYLHKEKLKLTNSYVDLLIATKPRVVLLPHPDPTNREHPDHTTVARSGINALRIVRNVTGLNPIVIHADTEDTTVVKGWEPNLEIPLTEAENIRYIASLRDNVTQFGDGLPPDEQQRARAVLLRARTNAEQAQIPGVDYLAKATQNTEFDMSDPSLYFAESADVFVSARAR
jgi:LmbE family N-acetylglucosaminyl deacetylase